MKRLVSLILVCLMVFSVFATVPDGALAFEKSRLIDVDGHWGRDSINKLVHLQVIKGYSDRTFRPSAQVTRAEFLAMVIKATGTPVTLDDSGIPFDDIKSGDWYYQVVKAAVSQNIITGPDYNGKFNGNMGITRKEVARIIVRGLELSIGEKLAEGQAPFGDILNLDKSFISFISKAEQAKVISGYMEKDKKLFKPDGILNRAEAAAVIGKYMFYLDNYTLQKYLSGKLNNDRQMEDIRFLASDDLKGRNLGSDGEKAAALYIEKSFQESNLKPWKALDLSGYSQSFKLRNMTDGRVIETSNVIGMIEGSTLKDEYLILAAHYDHIGTDIDGNPFNGADDDASGISALLEIARVFNENKIVPKKNILFCAFTGEEVGSLGSGYFIDRAMEKGITKMKVINVEVIGAAKGDYLEVFTQKFGGYMDVIENLKQSCTLQGINISVVDDFDPGSDAYPFLDYGIPAFSVDWAWSLENHPYYHSVDDDFVNINKDCVNKATEAIAGAVLLTAGVQ